MGSRAGSRRWRRGRRGSRKYRGWGSNQQCQRGSKRLPNLSPDFARNTKETSLFHFHQAGDLPGSRVQSQTVPQQGGDSRGNRRQQGRFGYGLQRKPSSEGNGRALEAFYGVAGLQRPCERRRQRVGEHGIDAIRPPLRRRSRYAFCVFCQTRGVARNFEQGLRRRQGTVRSAVRSSNTDRRRGHQREVLFLSG